MRSPVILRVFKNNQLIEVKQFDQNQIVVGQDAEVNLDLKGEGVSAIHCLIELRDAGYYVCDLGSQSGTFKNGQAVLDAPLSSGDEIGIGPFKIVFFFGIPKPAGSPTVTPPTPTVASTADTAAKPTAKNVAQTPPMTSSPTSTPKIPGQIPKEVSVPIPPKASPPAQNKKSTSFELRPTAKTTDRPAIRGTSLHSSKKGHKTFAPPSEIQDLRSYLKPGKGPVIEVIVAWQERILTTYHFKNQGVIRVGPGEDYAISLPDSAMPKGWPLLDISGGVRVSVGVDMDCEMIQSQGRKNLDELVKSGKAIKGGSATAVKLDQNEMLCLSVMGGTMQVFIRYAPQAPIVPLIPALLLSGSELTVVMMSLVMVGLLAFYISVTRPMDLPEEKKEDITHTAQIIFNNPPPSVKPPPPVEKPPEKPATPPPPEKAKVSNEKRETEKKGKPTPDNKATKAAVAGRAAEVAPIPNSQNRPKKFTSTKQGGAIKLGEKAGANAQSSTKDLSHAGLFSAFGPNGTRKQLDTSYQGAGAILGQADKATGTSGMDTNRAGDDLGSKIKDTGAGGKGTATEGISGIGTKGRSTGDGLYGSADGFGNKTSVAVEPGDAEADFVGTIDKEAVRRVIRHYQYEIRGCYQKELNKLEKGQQLEGKVSITWEIVAKGQARNVSVKSSTLNNKAIEACVRDRIASYTFPDPPAGMTAEVTFPFYFRPAK